MVPAKSPDRLHFEMERRRASVLSFLPGMGIGIIAADTWISPLAAIPGGFIAGAFAYACTWWYESAMWEKHHGK